MTLAPQTNLSKLATKLGDGGIQDRANQSVISLSKNRIGQIPTLYTVLQKIWPMESFGKRTTDKNVLNQHAFMHES